MGIDQIISWGQDHILAILAVVLTIVLVYHYLIEKDTGVKLSKKYRNSIYEAQSKTFLNATQYLISGNRDLAIREFLNAVDINRETIDTYFALGGLFRSNGEIEKAISIHRSLIARENISELARLRALKELAIDFDKGGFIDKAIETYKDVLKINRDQTEVIEALCKIYENIEEWDQAYNFRMMLSKVSLEDQAETISHILVQKAKQHFERGEFKECNEELEEAFRYAPSVSARILKLKLQLIDGNLERASSSFFELVKEHPMYASFIFVSLKERFNADSTVVSDYLNRLQFIKNFFLDIDDMELLSIPSIVLSKVRLFKEDNRIEDAYETLKNWTTNHKESNEVLSVEYIKLLIQMGKTDQVMDHTQSFLENFHKSMTRHFCKQCGFNSDNIFWRCPQCHKWETIQFRWKV